ncbi:iron-containing alcohol dehydrogenase [Paenalcaligenes niemegkensis]|uniref:iron-containing alcohol dehydrogenase n=1 Tax=Paenalcaligenes niemegkensis TaxID=2895469 RepID=UPI001EE88B62|nr:iron-containing alcohol dehydrogenase [Paenalcaligenes niemegkensis]MCQ9617919.1 iron-containing alcohol dehydrogenase [Paenalcaligenes niemegkensis]
MGASRVFLVVDPALIESQIVNAIIARLNENTTPFECFTEVSPDPDDVTVRAALDRCEAHKAEVIIAVGGGSTIDLAKAVALLMTNGGNIADYEGVDKFDIRPLPLFAVPTTAGTGSEVSGACVITDTARNVKMAIRHANYCPAQVAILDPLALSSMPAHVAAHAGIDAFVHAFESYLSKLANPFSDAVNLHAMKLISGSIRQFVANRNNTQAALDMLSGSSMAALSFGVTGLGNVHCMALPLGALFHVPHGLANAVCLPTVAEFNLIANPARYAHVAEILGIDAHGQSEIHHARCAVTAIRDMCNDLGIPSRLRDIGVEEDALDELARMSYAADYNRWNPRHTTEEDFRGLFRQAY